MANVAFIVAAIGPDAAIDHLAEAAPAMIFILRAVNFYPLALAPVVVIHQEFSATIQPNTKGAGSHDHPAHTHTNHAENDQCAK